MMYKYRKQLMSSDKKKGFTLIELIVVIVIIGIIAAIAVPNLTGYLERSRVTKAVSDASQLAAAMNTLNLTLKDTKMYTADGIDIVDTPDAVTLKNDLISKNLYPVLAASFDQALVNVAFDNDTRLYEARSKDDPKFSIDGY